MRNMKTYGAVVMTVAFLSATAAMADPLQDWVDGKAGGAPAIAYSGPAIDLKFSHPAPPASVAPPQWQKALDRFNGLTEGKVNFAMFGAGTLHGPRDGFKALRSGITDFATCYTSFEARGFELTKHIRLPFVTSGDALVDTRVMAEIAAEFLDEEFAEQGVIYAGSSATGPSDIMSKTPVTKLSDLKGMKLIAQGFPPEAAAALGFVTLNIPFPEIYTALQQGIADGVIWNTPGFVPYKIHEVAKHYTKVGLFSGAIDYCYTSATIEKLPADLRQPFMDVHQPMAALLAQRASIDYSRAAENTYREAGVTIHELEPGEREKMIAAIKPVMDEWVASTEATGKKAAAMLARIAELQTKYLALSNEELQTLIVEQPVKRPMLY